MLRLAIGETRESAVRVESWIASICISFDWRRGGEMGIRQMADDE